MSIMTSMNEVAQPVRHRPHQDDEQLLFDHAEQRLFAADDAEAGRRIGKILAALFVYTLIAMSIATWWTIRTVGF